MSAEATAVLGLIDQMAQVLLDYETDDDVADAALQRLSGLTPGQSAPEIVALHALVQAMVRVHLDDHVAQVSARVEILKASAEIFKHLQDMRNLVASFAIGRAKPSEEVVLQAIGASGEAMDAYTALVTRGLEGSES